MSLCQNCKEELPLGAKFCRRCGAKQEERPGVLSPPQAPHVTQQGTENDKISFAQSGDTRTEVTAPVDTKIWLAEQRVSVAAKLLMVMPFVNSSTRRVENKLLFEKNSGPTAPPLEHHSWDNIAFIAGLYGRFMGKYDLSPEQKNGQWDALVWAVLYEQAFRMKMVNDRFDELLTYFRDCAQDTAFLRHCIQTFSLLVSQLDDVNRKKIQSAVEHLSPSHEVQRLLAALEKLQAKSVEIEEDAPTLLIQPSHKSEYERILLSIERLWFLLDKKHESGNQRSLLLARQSPQDPQTPHRLATLAGIICRNAVFRYAHNTAQAGSNLSGEQLADIILLAEFSSQYSTTDYSAKSTYYSQLLRGLRDMRSHQLGPEAFINGLKTRYADEELARTAEFSWSDVLGIVSHHLAEVRKGGKIDSNEATAWIRAFASVSSMLPPAEKKAFSAEIVQHNVRDTLSLRTLQGMDGEQGTEQLEQGALAFLDPERRRELLMHIRNSHLEPLSDMLRSLRPALLSGLIRLLVSETFDQILPPRRALRIRGRSTHASDRFQEARNLLLSQNPKEQREALGLFERATMETAREFAPLAREWRLFATATVHGLFQVVQAWEEERRNNTASWEVLWNLAVFSVRVGDGKQALEILRPGIQSGRAPFAHVYFACVCALKLLLQEPRVPQETYDLAASFLVETLELLPFPESYLTWFLLLKEMPTAEPPLVMKQLKMLDLVLKLLNHPIIIPSPDESLTDGAVEALEKELHQLQLERSWQIWINDYAERNRFKFAAWQALAEASERGGDAARAEEALLHIAAAQLEIYQRQIAKSSTMPTTLTHVRNHLVKLFDFYQRKGRLQESDVLATFRRYYDAVPLLWNDQNSQNNRLIKLTRSLRESVPKNAQPAEPQEKPPVVRPLPNPYVFDRPLDFNKDHPGLFQGRDDELAVVRDTFFKQPLTERVPLYFYGIPRVGKTTFLRRAAQVLTEGRFTALIVDLHLLHAASLNLEQAIHEFSLSVLKAAYAQGIAVQGVGPVPVRHPQPLYSCEQLLRLLRTRSGSQTLVLLLDEVVGMATAHTAPLLSLLYNLHREGLIQCILAGSLRSADISAACPDTQLFSSVERPLGFLPLNAVKRVLSEPIAQSGVEIPDVTVQYIVQQTAGNPYHLVKLAHYGLERLKTPGLSQLTPQIVDEVAASMVADVSNFTSSSFSPAILTAEEQRTALHFARSMDVKSASLPVATATGMFRRETIQVLEEKGVLEYIRNAQGERLRICGKLLATFLRSDAAERLVFSYTTDKQRVGLFVDYENIVRLAPAEMTSGEIASALINYATHYGDVVCSWASADPRNIRDLPRVKFGLEQAGFSVRIPSDEPQTGPSTKNLVDFVLLELISNASLKDNLTMYIIVSGDKDYYERVMSLLDHGAMVRLCASRTHGHLAEKYRRLEEERRQLQLAQGKALRDFSIDDLDKILQNRSAGSSA